MPSLDGVGRYYPLTLHAIADADAPIAPPDIDTQDEWFGMAENFLLSTLAQRYRVRRNLVGDWTGLRFREPDPALRSITASVSLGDGMAGMVTDGADFGGALSALRVAGPEVYAAASFWWTAGGGDFPPSGAELPRLAGPVSLFHLAYRRSRRDRPCEMRFARSWNQSGGLMQADGCVAVKI